MKKVLFTLMFLLVVAAISFYWLQGRGEQLAPLDPQNTTYNVDGQPVALINGSSTEQTPRAATKVTTHYFGNEARGDLSGDGFDDLASVLTRDGGGSGTFFYIVAAINTPQGYHGTNAILLGDRIAPQSTEIRNGEIIVNYADRKPTDPMTTPPSVGVSRYFKIAQGTLVEVTKPAMRSVQLYYYNARKDAEENGNIACSDRGLVAVERQLPDTDTIIPETIAELLHGSTSPAEMRDGLTANFPLPGVTLTSSSLKDGVLVLTFADPEHKTSGGACRASILRMQIERTAKQFEGVTQVDIEPKDLFQP